MKKISLAIVFLFIFSIGLFAQLDYQNVITIPLNDGTQVTLYGRAGDEKMTKISTDGRGNIRYTNSRTQKTTMDYADGYYYTGDYYYLPVQLKLGKRPDGTPEFLFMKYTTEQRIDAGGAQGAIMHFLMEWGLSKEQEQELNQKLKAKIDELKKNPAYQEKLSKVTNPVVIGPVRLKPAKESFRIISATLNDKTMAPVVIASGKAPSLPGAKVAVASKLDKYGAQLLAATFEKNRSITDLSLELNFQYDVLMPAIKGVVTIDWSKLDSLYAYYEKKNFEERQNTFTQTDSYFWGLYKKESTVKSNYKDYNIKSDRDEFAGMLQEAKVVDINLTNMAPESEIAKTIVSSMMSLVTESLTSDASNSSDIGAEEDSAKPQEGELDDARKNYVNFSRTKIKTKASSGKQVIRLDYRATITEDVSLTGNLASWYDGVKNNKKCINTVNLNDPFFSHRDIHFILDNKVKDVFENEVNYVTVNVRKNRSNGNPFDEQLTIDDKFLKENGARASFVYARGEDRAPDMYEYKTQWSLRGGKLFPENPTWIKGDWQGVQLTCPMVPRTIQFEADLEEMKQMGIVRATLQLRYMKYGVERETNIPMTVSQGKALVEGQVFIDEDTPGYAYRLVMTHKEKGKVALEWETKINDDYVYASLPKKLTDNDAVFWGKVMESAKLITEPEVDGTVKLGNRILDKFMKVLKVITDKN